MKFNPQIRKAIYAAVAGVVPLLVIAGIVTGEQSQAILSSVAAMLAFFASVLAVNNTQTNNPEGEFEDVTEGTEEPFIPGV
jgi:hypothetical protein